MKKAEKICDDERSPAYKKELKKQVKRARRREEKKDPENALGKTKEFIRGWST